MTPAQPEKFNGPLDAKYKPLPVKRQAPDQIPVTPVRPWHKDP